MKVIVHTLLEPSHPAELQRMFTSTLAPDVGELQQALLARASKAERDTARHSSIGWAT